MPFARCREYDDDGFPVRGGCRRGDECGFIHPDNRNWNEAPRKSNQGFRGPGASGRNSGAGPPRHANVVDRMASSKWSIPSSPPKADSSSRQKPDWETDNWVSKDTGKSSTITTCLDLTWKADARRDDDKGKSTISGRGDSDGSSRRWANISKNTSINKPIAQPTEWGDGSGVWGGGDSTWEDKDKSLNEDVASAWGVKSDTTKPSGSGSGSCTAQPASNGPPPSSSTSGGKANSRENPPATADPRLRNTSTDPKTRTEQARPTVSTSGIRKPSVRESPVEPPSASSNSVTPSASPVVAPRIPTGPRVSVKKPFERLEPVSASKRSREISPAQSEVSHITSNPDQSRSLYVESIEKMVTLALHQKQLAEAQARHDRWKRIQASKQLERVRPGGRKKLNDTRYALYKECQNLKKRLGREQRSLSRLPDLSSPPKFEGGTDIATLKQTTVSYIKEAEEWIMNYQRRQEQEQAEKERMEREQRERREALQKEAPQSEPDPLQVLGDRIANLRVSMEELGDDIDDSRDFDAAREAEYAAHSKIRSKLSELEPEIQEHAEDIPKLRAELEAKQRLLVKMQEKHEENLRVKAQIEQTMAAFEQSQRDRAARIEALRGELIGLHNLRPISYQDQLRPQIDSLVETTIKEQVLPVLEVLSTHCREAADESCQLATSRIEEKLRSIEAFTSQIRAAAEQESTLVRGHQ
ncbi:hypothetical protein V5O48_000940 [Marasmius crinis-equi]|uniref:C3H1-type domain-containing protein n=1 Tax=Marasmius crinis-equi TaxID=585013 RepID=A0ABR3G014_9AGAR